jgi:small subunit ribosomal protein S21
MAIRAGWAHGGKSLPDSARKSGSNRVRLRQGARYRFNAVATGHPESPLEPLRKDGGAVALHLLDTKTRREFFLQVMVRDNNVDQALRVLKKKMQREGVFREMKRRRFYEKPSEKAAREEGEAIRRARKLARKKAQREGLIAAPKGKKVPPGRATGRPPFAGAGGPSRMP